MIDIETGEITVLLDGAPIAKKLELLKDVANSDNRIIGRGKGKYGFRRIMGTESIVLTVRMNQRTHDKMSKIFKTFVNNVRDIIEQNPDMATEICRVRCVPNITEEMYAMMRGNVPSISNDDRQ